MLKSGCSKTTQKQQAVSHTNRYLSLASKLRKIAYKHLTKLSRFHLSTMLFFVKTAASSRQGQIVGKCQVLDNVCHCCHGQALRKSQAAWGIVRGTSANGVSASLHGLTACPMPHSIYLSTSVRAASTNIGNESSAHNIN